MPRRERGPLSHLQLALFLTCDAARPFTLRASLTPNAGHADLHSGKPKLELEQGVACGMCGGLKKDAALSDNL